MCLNCILRRQVGPVLGGAGAVLVVKDPAAAPERISGKWYIHDLATGNFMKSDIHARCMRPGERLTPKPTSSPVAFVPPSPAPTPGAPTKAPTSPPTVSPTHQVATYEDLPPSLVQIGTNHAGKAVMKLELETAVPTARPTAAPTPVPTGFPTPLPTASPTGFDQVVALVLRIPVLIHRSYRPISRSKSKQSTICHAVASSAGFELDKNRGAYPIDHAHDTRWP